MVATDIEPWRDALVNFEGGSMGASVRSLSLLQLSPREANDRLIRAGFWPQRFGVPSHWAGQSRWRRLPFGNLPRGADAPDLAAEIVYVHEDGGVVRLFSRGPLAALDVQPGPWARKSVLLARPLSRTPLGVTLDEEAFAVSESGTPLPKSPRLAHGLKFDRELRAASFDLARATIVGARVPLADGPLPPVALTSAGNGLTKSFTIVPPKETFWSLAEQIQTVAREWWTLSRDEAGDVRFFFAGGADVFKKLRVETPRTGLASVCIHRGACVITVEAFGYEASVEQLREFCQPFLDVDGFRVFDDATGTDLTTIAARFPDRLFAPEAKIDMTIDAFTV